MAESANSLREWYQSARVSVNETWLAPAVFATDNRSIVVLATFVEQPSDMDIIVTALISLPFVLALFAVVYLLLRRNQ
jgi:hypothetical protein